MCIIVSSLCKRMCIIVSSRYKPMCMVCAWFASRQVAAPVWRLCVPTSFRAFRRTDEASGGLNTRIVISDQARLSM